MNTTDKFLVLGSAGQIGTDLIYELRKQYGNDNVISADIKDPHYSLKEQGPFKLIDVLDAKTVHDTIVQNKITQVYLLAAMLSATAEQKIKAAWKLNMDGLFNILDIAKELKTLKVFFKPNFGLKYELFG